MPRGSLNPRQVKFCEALAADPERNQTRAAIAAGVNPKTAGVWGCRNVTIPKVQERLAQLTGHAMARNNGRAVAKISRVLEVLAEQMEVAPPQPGAAEWLTRSEDGTVTRFKPQAAAIALGTMLSAPQQPQQQNTLVLAGLDPDILKALLRHAMGGNERILDVQAEVQP